MPGWCRGQEMNRICFYNKSFSQFWCPRDHVAFCFIFLFCNPVLVQCFSKTFPQRLHKCFLWKLIVKRVFQPVLFLVVFVVMVLLSLHGQRLLFVLFFFPQKMETLTFSSSKIIILLRVGGKEKLVQSFLTKIIIRFQLLSVFAHFFIL